MAESEIKIRENQNKDDWRNMLMDILKQVKETNTIDTILLNKKYPPESISKDIPAWVTYEGDKSTLNLKELNQEMKNFDYLNLFGEKT